MLLAIFTAPPAGAAIYAYRAGGLPSLRALGFTKLLTRYEGYVEAPKSYSKSQIGMAFEFPTGESYFWDTTRNICFYFMSIL